MKPGLSLLGFLNEVGDFLQATGKRESEQGIIPNVHNPENGCIHASPCREIAAALFSGFPARRQEDGLCATGSRAQMTDVRPVVAQR